MKTRMNAVLATAALAAALVAAGCGKPSDAPAAKSSGAAAPDTALLAAADLAVAAEGDLAAGVPVSGPLSPGWEARLSAPLDDIVEEVLVKEGQRVTAGQALARYRLGTVAAAAASSKAALKSAGADWQRQKNLLSEGAVSERDVETAEAAYRAAAAQSEADERRLADATVRAPRAGTVTTRSVQSGTRTSKGDPLFVVADTRELELEATVPSEFVPLVRTGAAVELSVAGWNGAAITGRVARINATADAATRQVKVYATVPNPGGRLVGDLYATGNIVTGRATHVLAVPTAALRRDDSLTVAWIVDKDSRARRRTVRAGLRDERADRVQVLEGLAAGDRVITGTAEGLVEGQAVRVAGKDR